jgi:hypothetical protein
MRPWFLCALTVLPLVAQPSQLSLIGATGTQIVIGYGSPDDNACTVTAINDSDPAVVIYDLDTTKFPGSPVANSDFRHAWNLTTRQRTFVVGQRTSATAADGKLYSRALEVDAPHDITVTCAGVPATLRTKTSRLPSGDFFPENPPFNPAGLGNYAWPSIDWTDHNHPYIDPMTGVKIKFASFPGDWSNKSSGLFGTNFWVDQSGGHWLNPANAVSGSTSTLATYSDPSGNEPLFLGVDPALSVSNRLYGGWGGGEPPWSVDDFGVHVIGSASDALPQNRTVSVCLTIDSGQTCYTNSITVVLPQGAGAEADTGVLPSNFPTPIFGGWGKLVLRSQLPTSGTADISGNTVTLTGPQNGSTFFNASLKPGSKISVTGSAPACVNNLCTVTGVQNGTHLSLAETVNLTAAAFTFANFGVRIVKTTGTGSVSVSLRYENAWSFPVIMPPTGNTEMCGRIPVPVSVDAAGNPLPNGQVLTGYNCAVNGNWYWISSDTGESRLISVTNSPPASMFASWDARDVPNLIQAPPGVGAFDLLNGNVAYVYGYLNAGGKALFKLTYNGNYRALNYQYPAGHGGELPSSISDNITWTNISPTSLGRDIASQIRKRFPAYDANRFGAVTDFNGISGDYAMFLHTIGGQDTPCWVFLYNIERQTLDYGYNSWDGTYDPILRWQACHSGGPGAPPNTATISNKPLVLGSTNANYGGPFVSLVAGVLRGGVWDTANTAVASDPDGSYNATCPLGLPLPYTDLGGTNRCLTILVAGEACSAAATVNEKIWSPCPWDTNRSMLQPMQVGDYITNLDIGADSERMIIVRKTVLSASSIQLVLERNVSPFCGSLAFQRVNLNGWHMLMAASGIWTCEGGFLVNDILNHKVSGENHLLLNGHFDYGVGSASNTFSLVGQGYFSGINYGYAIRDSKPLSAVGSPADLYVNMDPKFSGVAGVPFTFLQMYASKHQWTAPDPEKRWALDFRHLNGSFGIPQDSGFTSLAANMITPVAGTSSVYRISVLGGVNVKKIPLLGFAGRYLLHENSSALAGDTLTDADQFRFCYAYRDAECRHDATAGQAFVNVPGATLTGFCQAAQFARNIPCLMTAHPLGAWAIQFDATRHDATGAGIRRLTMGFMGPGRQYAYGNLRATPDGKWALMSGWWIDGVREDALLVKLPSFRETDSANRSDFAPVTVIVGSQVGATQAVVDFGYAEYGFRCTARAEPCSAIGSTVDAQNPFMFASELTGGAPCSIGCTIQIPALPARVLYYQIRYLDATGQTVQTMPLQVVASPETGG